MPETDNLEMHVGICSERWRNLEKKLASIERVLWWSSTMLISGMAGIIVKLVGLK